MTIKANFPAIKPSLNLDFANSKVLDPRITFSRASTATYYDGKTTVKAEENLWYPSNDGLGGNVEVTKTANAAVAPDGTTTALLIVPSTVTGNHVGGYKSFPVADAVAFFSFYVKASGYDKVRVGDASSSRIYGTFDLTALSVTASGGPSYLDSGIIDVGNGWRRCWIKYNNVGSPGFAPAVTPIPTGATVNNYGQVTGTGDGTSGVYFWGFQVEQRSALTALTQTTTAPITNRIPALQTAAANVARFDHDPVTGESKGLLIEEQRTNLLTYSSDFDNAAWPKTNITLTPNATTAPDGTLTADLFAATTNTNAYYYRGVSLANGTYTYSIYVKKFGVDGTHNFYFNDATSSQATVTMTFTGGVLSLSSVLTNNVFSAGSATATKIGNGWYRVALTATITNGTGPAVALTCGNTGRDGYSGIYIWGAQLETGAFPTSYIPTTSAQVTRSADAASITGSNFTSISANGNGTLYMEFDQATSDNADRIIAAIYGTSWLNNAVHSRTYGTSMMSSVYNGATSQGGTNNGALSVGKNYRLALAFAPDDMASVLSGGSVATDTTVTIPSSTFNTLDIGGAGSTTAKRCGTIKRIAYYPKRLSNTELQALTA